jgi:hypothetical protein
LKNIPFLITFIYGSQVEDYEMQIMNGLYKIEGIDFEEVGILTNEEFKAIIKCVLNSASTKRKIKRFLENF